MAVTGAAPKPTKLGHSPTVDWTEVLDEPYTGPSPDLPARPAPRKNWHQAVLDWWSEIRAMPHCRLWTETDWRFATETAFMKQQFWMDMLHGPKGIQATLAVEIRRREDQMGTTVEARRKLRIRYVSKERSRHASGPGAALAAGGDRVVDLDDRRARLSG